MPLLYNLLFFLIPICIPITFRFFNDNIGEPDDSYSILHKCFISLPFISDIKPYDTDIFLS